MPQFKAVLFDFNGVIIDDEPLHLRLFQEVCRDEGIELPTRAYYDRYLGYDDRSCFAAVFADHGRPLNPTGLQQLIDKKASKYLRAIRLDGRLFPGVEDLIHALEGKVFLAIVSGALRHEIELVSQNAGIHGAFDVIISANDTHFGKPNPEGFVKALTALQALALPHGLHAKECLVIEDSLAGIQAAHAAGMPCLAISNSYSKDELRAADWVRGTLQGLAIEELT